MTWKDLNFYVPLTKDDKKNMKINRFETDDLTMENVATT